MTAILYTEVKRSACWLSAQKQLIFLSEKNTFNPMNTSGTYIDRLLQLIAKDELKAVLAELQNLLRGSPAYDKAILQSARYNGLMKDIRTGTIDLERAEVQKNQLRYALTDMVRELEDQLPEQPELQREVEQYLQQRPVHNEARITGDGNVNVQGVSGSQINIQQNDKDKA